MSNNHHVGLASADPSGCEARNSVGVRCGKPAKRSILMRDPLTGRTRKAKICRACYPKLKTQLIAKHRRGPRA